MVRAASPAVAAGQLMSPGGRVLVTVGTGTLGVSRASWWAQHGAALAPGTLPLLAILHAGGVLADATLANQSLHSLRQVHAPKALSLAKWLAASSCQPAAAQVLFSSVASLVGAPGQANYSAANSALDASAAAMRSQGLSSTSVQWGAWAGAGMAAQDARTAARIERMGMGMMQPAQGLAALEGALGSIWVSGPAPAVLAATPFSWQRFLARLPAAHGLSSEFAAPAERAVAGRAAVGAAGGGRRAAGPSLADIERRVGATVAAVVGQDVATEVPLMEAGLDSLGAVELRNSLSTAFEMELPPTLTFDYPSVAAISSFIAAAKHPAGFPEEPEAAPGRAAAAAAAAATAAAGLLGRGGLGAGGAAKGVADAIVLSGLSLRFAGSASVGELYVHMRNGSELHTVAPYPR